MQQHIYYIKFALQFADMQISDGNRIQRTGSETCLD